jgi:flagellar hook-basal body complex protein FliE
MISNAISSVRILPADLTPARVRVSEPNSFVDTLKETIDQVQGAQNQAQSQVTELLNGNGADLHRAMIAVEKADLSFQLMMQVRNKIVAAYQEVSRLQF